MTSARIVLVAILACCLLIWQVLAEDKKYTTKYDDIDIDAVINNERLLNGYVNCLLDRGPCTPDAAELKKNLPDALEHDCSACSEVQKNAANKIAQYLIDHRLQDWNLLEEKYDSTGDYRRRYLHDKFKQEAID